MHEFTFSPDHLRQSSPDFTVALFVFNRPDKTSLVFERVAAAKPSRLLIVADGARPDCAGEAERVEAVKSIVSSVDWECDVLTNYSTVNLGCKRRLSSGLDWVFSTVESAIVLEDDCLPDPTFFGYCRELLERYRDDERVMVISGDNFQPSSRRTDTSYYFSRYSHVWGWASWRRAWSLYDVNMRLWPALRDTDFLLEILGTRRAAAHWRRIFDSVYAGEIDTWDYQLTFACWAQHALCILPTVNLVSNIGFGSGATHTDSDHPVAGLATRPMRFPLRHPESMVRDRAADDHTENMFGQPSIPRRVANRLRRMVASPSTTAATTAEAEVLGVP